MLVYSAVYIMLESSLGLLHINEFNLIKALSSQSNRLCLRKYKGDIPLFPLF